MRGFSIAVLAVVLSIFTAALAVTSEQTDEALRAFSISATEIETSLTSENVSDEAISTFRAELEGQRRNLAAIETETLQALGPLRARLAPLVPEGGGETVDPIEAEQRASLETEIAHLESLLRRTRQAIARAEAMSDDLNRERRDRFTRTLMTRGPSPVMPERIGNMWASLSFKMRIAGRDFKHRLDSNAAGIDFDRFALPVVLAVIAMLIGFNLRRWLVQSLLRALGPESSSARKLVFGVGITLGRMLVPSLALIIVYTGLHSSGLVGPLMQRSMDAILASAVILIGSYSLSGAFYAPGAPGLRLSVLDNAHASRAHRWLIVTAAAIALDQIFVIGGTAIGLSIDALAVLNSWILIFGSFSLVLFVYYSQLGETQVQKQAPDDQSEGDDDEAVPSKSLLERLEKAARIIAQIVAVLAPLLALLGYFGASRFVFYPPVVTGALICVCILLYNLVAVGTNGVSGTQSADTESPNPLRIVPVFFGFALFIAAIPLLAMIWGADRTDLEVLWARVLEGFKIGGVRLAPADFLLSVIVFMIGFVVTRGTQGILGRSVLPLTKLDRGAQSALTAGVGYIGITISALFAVSAVGLDLSNIAIVAGALSVGIGFGLQTIVNNFVSGIILLLERPIKAGDWVEIGGVHGTVQQVNVRSTEIQTFDRSTMFVPNADLVSGTVTNWTHSNSMGRLIVPVGVAYGSDTRQVEKILLEIARGHPMLLRRPEPFVVFSGFGADSLDFEVRGVLRDVNWIIIVGSDIRHSIYERFAQEGIQIPFAQRDIYIKNASELRGDSGS